MLLAIITFEDNSTIHVYEKDLDPTTPVNKSTVFTYIGGLYSQRSISQSSCIKSIFYNPSLI